MLIELITLFNLNGYPWVLLLLGVAYYALPQFRSLYGELFVAANQLAAFVGLLSLTQAFRLFTHTLTGTGLPPAAVFGNVEWWISFLLGMALPMLFWWDRFKHKLWLAVTVGAFALLFPLIKSLISHTSIFPLITFRDFTLFFTGMIFVYSVGNLITHFNEKS